MSCAVNHTMLTDGIRRCLSHATGCRWSSTPARNYADVMFYTIAAIIHTNVILAVCIGLVAMMAGLFAGQYLVDTGGFDAVEIRAALDPRMSEESLSLAAQASIAECMAGESRQMLAAWTLDLRSASGYASDEYMAGMERLIEAVSTSAMATEAWAETARWAAADGIVTDEELETLAEADAYMSSASAGVYGALMGPSSTQPSDISMLGLAEAYTQAWAVQSGSETDCR